MIHTAEQLAESFRALPNAEREKFFRLLGTSKKNGTKSVAKHDRDEEQFRKALKWIDENRKKYDGQFVLLEGDVLLAHGIDSRPLYEEARRRGIKTPFVKKVRAEIPPFGGW